LSSIRWISWLSPAIPCSSSHLQNRSIVASSSSNSAHLGSKSGESAGMLMNSIRLGRIDSSQISSLLFDRAFKSIAMGLCVVLGKWILLLFAKHLVGHKSVLVHDGMGISHKCGRIHLEVCHNQKVGFRLKGPF